MESADSLAVDPEAADDPSVPAPKAIHGKTYCAATAHPTFRINPRGDGKSCLKYDTKLRSLSAHCGHPKHGDRCRIQRKTTEHPKDPNSAQGRPAGILLAWAACANEYKTGIDHMNCSRGVNVYLCEWLSSAQRKRWRQWLTTAHPDVVAELECLERHQREGEDIEPDDHG